MNPFRTPASPREEVPCQPIAISARQEKVASIKAQVDEVMGAMQTNLNLALERGEALESIHIQTGTYWETLLLENLQAQSEQFKRAATETHSRLWWRNVWRNLLVISFILVMVAGLLAFWFLYRRLL